jgi:hypothetical protein
MMTLTRFLISILRCFYCLHGLGGVGTRAARVTSLTQRAARVLGTKTDTQKVKEFVLNFTLWRNADD